MEQVLHQVPHCYIDLLLTVYTVVLICSVRHWIVLIYLVYCKIYVFSD
jgi:hypothetical protein